MGGWTVNIDRKDISCATLEELVLPPLEAGQVAVSIDSVGMTANNVTYAMLGDYAEEFGEGLGYFDYFGDRDQPGQLPMWGFATVTESLADGVAVGDRLYGYFPLSSDAILTVGAVGKRGFIDVTPRRTRLPALYNGYKTLSGLPDYRTQDHDLWPIYRGLFFTAWLMMDQAEDEHDFGAEQVLVTSASCKTAISFAYLTAQRSAPKARLIGVTSARNKAFVTSLRFYDQVVTYDEIETMDPSIRTALIDLAGDRKLVGRVHAHFGARLSASIAVGFSHWDASQPFAMIDGIQPVQFFAPGRSMKRAAEWGGARLAETIAAAWLSFMDTAARLTEIDRRHGGQGALEAYRDAVSGRINPRGGIIIERD